MIGFLNDPHLKPMYWIFLSPKGKITLDLNLETALL